MDQGECSQEWIKVVGRGDDWLPKTYTKICSKHFGGHMICKKRLLPGAFPLLSGCDGTSIVPFIAVTHRNVISSVGILSI